MVRSAERIWSAADLDTHPDLRCPHAPYRTRHATDPAARATSGDYAAAPTSPRLLRSPSAIQSPADPAETTSSAAALSPAAHNQPVTTAHYIPKPHISAAVKQLRTWVCLCASVFALAAATQMLVFGFAQYTDVRWTEVREVKLDRPLRVVGAPGAGAPAAENAPANTAATTDAADAESAASTTATAPKSENFAVGGVRSRIGDVKDAVDINRVKSESDRIMQRASAIACGVGVISAIMLTVFALLGVGVAGGASIPGVERVVTAGAWSFLLALMCLPWNALLPTLGIPGVFVGYEAMTLAIDAKHTGASGMGTFAALMQWVGAPLVAMFTSLGVCMWFRAGVDRGVIVTAPSELDKAVEREVEMISKRGVGASTPKAVGALNRAIGDDDHPSAAPASGGAIGMMSASGDRTLSAVERAIEHAAHTANSMAEETTATGRPRRTTRSVVDGDFKRPI